MFGPRVCPLRQPAMLPTNVATSLDKMEKFGCCLGLQNSMGGGTLMLGRLGLLADVKMHLMNWMTRTTLDDVEALWGTKDLIGCQCSRFV